MGVFFAIRMTEKAFKFIFFIQFIINYSFQCAFVYCLVRIYKWARLPMNN